MSPEDLKTIIENIQNTARVILVDEMDAYNTRRTLVWVPAQRFYAIESVNSGERKVKQYSLLCEAVEDWVR